MVVADKLGDDVTCIQESVLGLSCPQRDQAKMWQQGQCQSSWSGTWCYVDRCLSGNSKAEG